MSTISASTTSTTAYKVTADTTGTLVFQTGATPTTALTLGSDQSVTFAGTPTYSGGTANGVLYLNGSKAITSGSALVFNGTNLGIGTSTPSSILHLYDSAPLLSATSSNNSSGLRFNVEGTAATTYRFQYGGTTQLTLDSAGNLGLGVTPSAWSLGKALEIGYVGHGMWGNATNETIFMTNAYYNSGWKYSANSQYATQYAQRDGQHAFYNAPQGGGSSMGTAITWTQAMTLDASGNLGVGVTSMNASLHVQGSATTDGSIAFNSQFASTTAYNSSPASGSMVALKYTSGGSYAGMGGWSIGKENATDGNYSSYFAMHTRANGGAITERARIDSSGNLLVGTTSALFSGANRQFVVNNSGGYAAGFGNNNAGNETVCIQNADTTGTRRFVVFKAGTSGVGEISSNGSTTTYGTSSDYRLKENIQPMTGALFTVSQLKPCTYTWKADGSAGEGFIAHELAEVCPHAVTGEKDAVNEDGSIKPQGIDTSFLVATLTAAIQELKAELDTAKAQIAALQGAA